MKAIASVVGLFAFTAWDMAANHGAWTRPAAAAIIQILRNFGIV